MPASVLKSQDSSLDGLTIICIIIIPIIMCYGYISSVNYYN